MKAKELYSVGIYLRLSREDVVEEKHSTEEKHSKNEARSGKNGGSDNAEKESNSIRSQRELVRSFVRSQKDMEIYDIYVDDGYSGANFVEVR